MNRATTIRFPRELKENLKGFSKETGMTVNALVIQACLKFLKEENKPDQKKNGFK